MAANTWHKTHKTWKNINKFLFQNQTMSDCTFLVEVEDITVKIPAHKYVLGAYSPEFFSLFYLMKADSDEIPINDVSMENLTKFLEFVYTETTELSLNNVGEILLLAFRYSVESLKDFCLEFLFKNITEENVLSLMDQYLIYKLPNFESECFKKINRNHTIFEDPSLLDISNTTLTTILKSEDLKDFKEITIFAGVDKWAEQFCHRNKRIPCSENKRLALGPALKHIRFGTMSNEEFISCTSNLSSSVLTMQEIIQIFHFIGTGRQLDCPYSGDKRKSVIKTCALNTIKATQTRNRSIAGYTLINFTVSKAIKLHGFGMLGRVNKLDTKNPENFLIRLMKETDGATLNESLVCVNHDGTNKIYEMFFKTAAALNPNTTYGIYAKRQNSSPYEDFDNFISHSMPKETIIDVDGVVFTVTDVGGNIAAALMFEEL